MFRKLARRIDRRLPQEYPYKYLQIRNQLRIGTIPRVVLSNIDQTTTSRGSRGRCQTNQKGGDQQMKKVLLLLLLQLLVCQLEVSKEDVLLVVASGDDDSFDSIYIMGNIFAYICIPNHWNLYFFFSFVAVFMTYNNTDHYSLILGESVSLSVIRKNRAVAVDSI